MAGRDTILRHAVVVCMVLVGALVAGCFVIDDGPQRPAGFGTVDAGGDVGQDVPTGFATVVGTVSRTVEPEDGEDGAGTLFVVLLDEDPLSGGTHYLDVAMIANADLSADDASIPFELTEPIPVRSEPYYLVAFLDDDEDAGMSFPMPRHPDLFWFKGGGAIGVPTVSLIEPGERNLNIVLNMVYPQGM